MIIVTGTKRSGTSMWMQILAAAGIQVLGEAFPGNWDQTIGEANPHGFFESRLRAGIYYATNPHPMTGDYLDPTETARVAVKVFIPGLCRTDLAFVRQVVATMRHWREYAASIERLRRLEDEALADKRPQGPPERMDPVLEWWLENFALIRDIVTRSYPVHVVTYENVVDSPQEALPPVLEWVGADDVASGVDVVRPDAQTQDRARIERSHPFEDVFDELYETVGLGHDLTGDFLQRINETHRALIPQIEQARVRVMRDRFRRRRTAPRRNVLHPDTLQSLIHGDEEE